MQFQNLLDYLGAILVSYHLNLLASVAVLLVYFFLARISLPKIHDKVGRSKFKAGASIKAYQTVKWIGRALAASAFLLIWGIDFRGLLLVSTTIITLTGVALFANWSILSNITAFFVLLVHKSYSRGNFIQVIDGDNYLEGYISEINLFNTLLVTESRELVVYPNNLLLGRPTLINPRKRLNIVGKITDFAGPTESPRDSSPAEKPSES